MTVYGGKTPLFLLFLFRYYKVIIEVFVSLVAKRYKDQSLKGTLVLTYSNASYYKKIMRRITREATEILVNVKTVIKYMGRKMFKEIYAM